MSAINNLHDKFYPQNPIQINPKQLLDTNYIGQSSDNIFKTISPLYSVDEEAWLKQLLPLAKPKIQNGKNERDAISEQAKRLIEHVRNNDKAVKMVDSLLLEYSLDTEEGILLMSLAEALIRVPDNETADALIRDKMSVADWKKHLKDDNGFMVNASTWGLMMTGRVVSLDKNTSDISFLDRLTQKMGEPVIRSAMQRAMKIMGYQFVLGETIEEAKHNSEPYRAKGYTYSFDMLGEAAITHKDAESYFSDYLHAIKSAAKIKVKEGMPKPSVSIKLSALHPRYEATHSEQVMGLLRQRCLLLIEAARDVDVDISIDAEEADRLEISLKLFESLYRDVMTDNWDGLGIVVQGYSKRAIAVLAWLASLSKEVGDCIPVRLVKGAYWDSEIKLAQQKGFRGYPVWTRKEGTDVAYLACARFLLSEQVRGLIWPQFATHNAHTLASVMTMSPHRDFEFQRLHGMGDALYDHILEAYKIPVRIYAPVGAHKDLLPYLVRRLLENGANSSFVHQLLDKSYPVEKLTVHPYDTLTNQSSLRNQKIPLPLDIYDDRKASFGPNINVESQWLPFKAGVDKHLTKTWVAKPIVMGEEPTNDTDTLHANEIYEPWNHKVYVGKVFNASKNIASQSIKIAQQGFDSWSKTTAEHRANILRQIADLYEQNYSEFVALCQKEAGKTIQDCIDEVREAVDFCRFYANEAERLGSQVNEFVDLNGQKHTQKRVGRGVVVCISPWNFPLAIYTGQITGALAAGNTVVAKPAEQTSLIGYFAAKLMYEAGVPKDVLQFVTGGGDIGAVLTSSNAISGVIFTGSTQTAHMINLSLHQNHKQNNESDTTADDNHSDSTDSNLESNLDSNTYNNTNNSNEDKIKQSRLTATQSNEDLPFLVAETGGQNAMIVDSTALPEQVVKDAVLSAFGSAGQRCSACRVLCIQDDVADEVIDLLKGSMAELIVGNPCHVSTDVGPVIDEEAQNNLTEHIKSMRNNPSARIITQTPISSSSADKLSNSTFVLPTAIEVDAIEVIGGEHFGPILHVIRYKSDELNNLINAINATRYGLTLGIHSRIEDKTDYIEKRVKVGNTYINRNQIGAVVNEQPFGGRGLSGTGPKAGGPHYVARFSKWQTI